MELIESLSLEHYALTFSDDGQPVVLSKDGTGTTFRGVDSRTDTPVIVRLFSRQMLSDRSAQSDFVTRAGLLIELDHPRITRIIDTGECARGFFYVLEDPGGETLHNLVHKRLFDVETALELQLQLVEILEAVRTQPALRSRVWPRNVLLSGDSRPRIHLIAQDLVNPVPPLEDPEFLAPEVLMGQAETDQSTLYAVGATLYFMITGKPPHPRQGDLAKLLSRIQTHAPDDSILPPSSPVSLLTSLLAPDPAARPRSLVEWERSLQRSLRFAASQKEPQAHSAEAKSETGDLSESLVRVTQLSKDLEDSKAHTQRLSLELTKRVQRELELSDRLKGLETELEQGRQELDELRRSRAATEDDGERPAERQRLEREWNRLQQAKQELEREKQEFLQKTQRLSLAVREYKKAQTKRVTAEPKLVRIGKRLLETAKQHVKAPKSHTSRDPNLPTPRPDVDSGPSKPSPAPGRNPLPSAAATAVPMAAEESSLQGSPRSQPATPPETMAATATPPSSETTVPKIGRGRAEASPFAAPFGRQPHSHETRETASDSATAGKPRFAKPAIAATAAVADRPGQPDVIPPDVMKDTEPSSAPVAHAPADRVVPSAGEQPDSRAPGVRPGTPPNVEAVPSAWLALILGALAIGLTLYLIPFQTFFAQPDETSFDDNVPIPATLDSGSVRLEAGSDPSEPADEELWVEAKELEHLRLIQNHEWEELLRSLERTEARWSGKSPESVARVRRSLLDDLAFIAEFSPPGELEKDENYRRLKMALGTPLPSNAEADRP